MATYGLPVDVDPHKALLEELHRTAGHVAWLGALIADLEHNDTGHAHVQDLDPEDGELAPVGQSSGFSGLKQYGRKDGLLWEKPSVWWDMYHQERRHLESVAKSCVVAGVAEYRVELVRQQGEQIIALLTAVITELGHDITAEPVRRIVGRHLRLVAGSTA